MTATSESDTRTFDLTSWKQVWIRSIAATVAVIVLAPLPMLAFVGLSSSGEDRSDGIEFVVSLFWGQGVWWIQMAVYFAAMIFSARKARDTLNRAWSVLLVVVGYVVAGIVCWSVAIGGFDFDFAAAYLAGIFVSFDAVIAAIVAAVALLVKRHSPKARYR